MDRNPAYAGHAIDLMADLDADARAGESTCKRACSNVLSCVRVSPWVPLLGAVMVGTGLPVWAIYTRRALATTEAFAGTAFGARTYAVEQLAACVGWATLLGVAVIASLVGLCLLLSLLRTYQEVARLPRTKCSAPGRMSYGSYAGLISIVTFGLWLVTVVVALLIAAQLSWLTLAFVFEQAVARGVTPSNAVVAPRAFRDATDALLQRMVDAPGMPTTGPLGEAIKTYQSAAQQATVAACPASCLSFGSFAAVFAAEAPCVCGGADQYYALLGAASDTWRHLVHSLAALSLMGLACLWLVMNLSATFAHANRDIADTKRAAALAAAGRFSDDATGAVYVTTNPEYRRSPDKNAATRRGDAHAPGRDTPHKSPARAAPASPSPAASARAAPEMLPSCVVGGAPAAGGYAPAAGGGAAAAGALRDGAGGEAALRESGVIAEVSGAYDGAAASHGGDAPVGGAAGWGSSGGGGAGGGGSSGGGGGAGRQQFNTTAQRYAAYRLRAAQAANANKTPERTKWAR